jgi:Protein kinase domain
MPYVGQRFGRYRIEEEIGAGGMGVVYRAYDEKLERDLAIKVLNPGALNDEAARNRFRNARILSRLNHPSIQTIHDFDNFEGHDYLVSELVPGLSLDARLRSGALPEKEVVHLGFHKVKLSHKRNLWPLPVAAEAEQWLNTSAFLVLFLDMPELNSHPAYPLSALRCVLRGSSPRLEAEWIATPFS